MILRNILFAPLIVDGNAVGVMGIANKPSPFDEQDCQLAMAFSEFASIALVNSRNNDKLRDTITQLETTLKEIKQLKGLLPICSHCKKIRDDEGYWHQVEEYVGQKADVSFTHSLCPHCIEDLYPGLSFDNE